MVKKYFQISLFCLFCLCIFSGCKPFEKPIFEEIGNSETVFSVPMFSDGKEQVKFDSIEYLKEKKVASKRIRIPQEWVQTGRKWFFGVGPYNGYYIPNTKVIKVDRAPVTVQWSESSNNAIWVESSDSIRFSTGFQLSARILTEDDAAVFLFNYPSLDVARDPDGPKTSYVATADLIDVLNREARAKVQDIFAEAAATKKMDTLRTEKNIIVDKIKKDLVPYFKERGVDITTIGQFGGIKYENKEIQDAIDKVFKAQQDKEVAKAEGDAAEERKISLKSLGEGQAAQALEIARGKAEAIKLETDAEIYKAEQLSKQVEFFLKSRQLDIQQKYLEKWDGKLPVTTLGENLEMLMPLDIK